MSTACHSRTGSRLTALLLAALFAVSSAISLFPSQAGAAPSPDELSTLYAARAAGASVDFGTLSRAVTPEIQALSASYYAILGGCFWQATDGKIKTSSANPTPTEWFNDTGDTSAFLDGAKTTCIEVATSALKLWGRNSTGDFLKAAGCTFNGTDQYSCYPASWSGIVRHDNNELRSHAVRLAILKQAYPSFKTNGLDGTDFSDSAVPLSAAANYVRYLDTFNNACTGTDLGTIESLKAASDQTTYNRVSSNHYSTSSESVTTVYATAYLVDGSARAAHGMTYETYVNDNYRTPSQMTGDGFADAYTRASETTVDTYGHSYKGWKGIDDASAKTTCTELVQGLSIKNAAALADYNSQYGVTKTIGLNVNPDVTVPTDKTTCAVNGVGWIVCPAVNFLANVADKAYEFLADNFLAIDTSLLNTDANAVNPAGKPIGTGAYSAWQAMRNIANVLLVIAFLVIIFSQLTGAANTNYGVKKMLPRLIIVAVLLNASFYVCQIAVDASNILGYGLKSLLANIAGSAVSIPEAAEAFSLADTAKTVLVAGVAGAGAVAATGGVTMALVALIGVLISAAIALVMIFFILVIRQMLIVLLVVMAPVAFVAYLLPNTEKLFGKWRELFTSMLMLFPVVGVIFGGSTLASNILQSAWASSDSTLAQIIAAAVLVLPLFLVPVTLKGALNGVGKLGATVNGIGTRLGGAADKGIRSSYAASDWNKYRQQKKADTRARIATGMYRGRGGKLNPQNWRSTANRNLNDNPLFNRVTQGFGASRFLNVQAQNRKDMAESIAMFNHDDDLINAWATDGGERGTAYAGLTEPQKTQYDRMRGAGLHLKSTSFFAAAAAMAEGGKGGAGSVETALQYAKRAGASETDISGAREGAIAAYRTSGRGDALADLSNIAGHPPMTQEQGWAQVAPSSVHREGIKAGSAGASSYENYLQADREHVRQALAGIDQMEARSRGLAEPVIIAAAQRHEAATLAPGAAPTVTDIQSAKTYFGIR